MAENKKQMRLSQVARKLNIGRNTIVEHLRKKGHDLKGNPNEPINQEMYAILEKDFEGSLKNRREASNIKIGTTSATAKTIDKDTKAKSQTEVQTEKEDDDTEQEKELFIKGNVKSTPQTSSQDQKKEDKKKAEPETFTTDSHQMKVVGKVDLDKFNKKKGSTKKSASNKQADKKETSKTVSKQETKATSSKQISSKAKSIDNTATKKNSAPKTTVDSTNKKDTVEKTTPKSDNNKTVKQDDKKSQKENKPSQNSKTPSNSINKNDSNKKVEASKDSNTKKEDKNSSNKATPQPSNKKDKRSSDSKKADNKSNKPETSVNKAKENSKKNQEKDIKATSKTSDKKEDVKGKGEEDYVSSQGDKLPGLKVVGKIDLSSFSKKKKSSDDKSDDGTRRRRRRRRRRRGEGEGSSDSKPQDLTKLNTSDKTGSTTTKPKTDSDNSRRRKKRRKEQPSAKEVQEQIKATLARMNTGSGKGGRGKRGGSRRDKREARETEQNEVKVENKLLKVTEFIPASDFANLLDVSINELISKGIGLGVMISINLRLDAEVITLLADEFGYDVEFTSAEEETEVVIETKDKPEDLEPRAPIVTIMGHVDHGKTTLLDYIRKAKVADGEAGGITQHIGAYNVTLDEGKELTFLDTPGHEAFTAMRARGAKVTDVVIIVVAADDGVMPQTREAINHAKLAEVPIIIAINKIDKVGANPDRVKQELADMNVLIEEWGGKYQAHHISAKKGEGIDELLEGVILEAEILELKANPNRNAAGTVVDASLDKGRGYVATTIVQNGTLKVGDVILAGSHFGKVRAMIDHLGNRLEHAPPSTPVQILGLDGAPQAGDRFNVMKSEREAKDIATRREQILREQSIRATRRLTLSDINRRLAIGNFQQLNLIIKGDVDGSVEALADSLQKLSTDEVNVNVVMKGVGQISESDINLATISDAIIIGFQVRPSRNARALADREQVEVRLYSVIYKAIDEVKSAIVGLLAPKIEEDIVGTVEIRETFKVSKVGVIAGCMVTTGKIKRNNKIRIIRDGIVIHEGEIETLKRYKDDVQEVKSGFECGISIKNYNEIQVGDEIESYEEREVKRTFEELKNATPTPKEEATKEAKESKEKQAKEKETN
ncbi:translation initiation factor IF-2 [Bernardetia sp. ABR2-2B]|uniref:translation initiation factor IF-2 n=1 Tax=Bernardetia sp. ABR2-2B TaxID=3127472 RepID=UPI0030D3CF3D